MRGRRCSEGRPEEARAAGGQVAEVAVGRAVEVAEAAEAARAKD